MRVVRGCTRTVFVGRRYAVKVAGRGLSWSAFLRGLLCNLTERQWSRPRRHDGRVDDRLCPVLWSDPLGLCVVMPRAEPMGYRSPLYLSHGERVERFDGLPLDNHRSNFGLLDGRVVLIDYGS